MSIAESGHEAQPGMPAGTGRDKPLSFHWRALQSDFIQGLRLPPAPSQKHEKARASIVLEAYRTARLDPEQFISYSRRKEFYSGQARYQGTHYTLPAVTWAVDHLSAIGLLEHDRAEPGRLGLQSAFRASPALIEAVTVPQLVAVYCPPESIRLKDADKHLMDYRDTEFTDSARRAIGAINEALRGADLDMKSGERINDNAIRCTKEGGGSVIADLGCDQLHRVFNRKFTLGGRFYGPWWQSVPKKDRAGIHIGGEATTEPDYSALHPRLLYARAGKQLTGDPYTLHGWERQVVKIAFNVMVNAHDDRSACQAIAQELEGTGAHRRAFELMAAIRRHHTAIEDFFCSGAGLWLMRADSDMAEHVMVKALRDNIVTLGVHDSFIAQARHDGRLRELMDEALIRQVRKLNPDAAELVAMMGAHTQLVLVMPPGPQGDLFAEVVSIPIHELKSWERGVIPPHVQVALRLEIDRCGITQNEMAAELGISRPQLTNALQGRFGVSGHVAERIKAILQEAAAA